MNYKFLGKLSKSEFDKNKLFENPEKYEINKFQGSSIDRFDVLHGEVNFECFISGSNVNRLFVFFSAAGRTNSKTAFHRASWSSSLNGTCLYIEDPMYKKHEGLSTGWFYGDSKESYLLKSIDIVKKVAQSKNIRNKNIIFIGSSSGAYASILAASLMPGTTAYAYNPQIRPRDWPDAKNFEKLTGLNLSVDEKFNRNCLRYVAGNFESKFFIFVNIFSKVDRVQIYPWLEELGIKPSNGLKVHGNIFFILQELKNQNPHNAIIHLDESIVLLSLLEGGDEVDESALNLYLGKLAESVEVEERLFYSTTWYKFLNNSFPMYLKKPQNIDLYYIDFKTVDDYSGVRYRISMQRLKKTATLIFYVLDWSSKVDTKLAENVIGFCKENSCSIDFDEQRDFARIMRRGVRLNDLYEEFSGFLGKSFPTIYSNSD